MKKSLIITTCLTFFLSIIGTNALAYDFGTENEDGITLYYNYINDGTELELADGNYSDYSYKIIKIPSEVTYMNRTRKVTKIGDNALSHSWVEKLIIPESIKIIGKEAIANCGDLKELTIPNSVETIEMAALSGLELNKLVVGTGLKKVTIKNDKIYTNYPGYVNIDTLVAKDLNSFLQIDFEYENFFSYKYKKTAKCLLFDNNKIVTDLVYPEGITKIGYAIKDCNSIEYVKIPQSIKEINVHAFWGCANLTTVEMHDDISKIGGGAFSDTGIQNIKLPANLETIEERLFQNSMIKTIDIPNKVTKISGYAFLHCNSLSSVTIPENVTEIVTTAFDTESLLTVISMIATPKDISDGVFTKNTYMNATLYVPIGSKDKYKAANGWKNFVFIEEGIPTHINTIGRNDNSTEIKRYSLNGQQLTRPSKGINIIKMSDGTTKKIIVR